MTTMTSLEMGVGREQVFISKSPEQTLSLGRCWGLTLLPPLVILLSGELGVGKTVLVRGLVVGLGIPEDEHISSPSFTLVNSYRGRCPVHHVDLYRLESLQDFNSIGLFELMEGETVTLIEWGERARPWIANGLEVEIEDLGQERRRLRCRFFNDLQPIFSATPAAENRRDQVKE